MGEEARLVFCFSLIQTLAQAYPRKDELHENKLGMGWSGGFLGWSLDGECFRRMKMVFHAVWGTCAEYPWG